MATIPGPKARKLLKRDKAVMSPSMPRSYPFAMAQGKGAEAWDVDGNRYIDFATGIAVTSTGHCHPDVVQAIKDQAEKFLHICVADFYYEVAVELAEKLDSIAPFQEKAQVFLTNSGTEAVEAAMKLARAATGRHQFLAFYGAFHGRSLGALSLTASKYTQKIGFAPMIPGVTHIPYPDPYRPLLNLEHFSDIGEAVIDFIENVVFHGKVPGEEVAAIFVEPILGEGGYVIPPASFFPALRELCDRYGILLVADEVQSGMGRTGKWWAIEHFGVEPDIVTSAKGIASGMPLGAMIARKSLMTWEAGAHGSTFGGNPVCCAAALATIRVIENGLLENAVKMGDTLLRAFKKLQSKHSSIGNVRGKGLMVGMEFVEDRKTKAPAHALRDDIALRAFQKGLLMLPCGWSALRVMPPLNVHKAVADEALAILDEAITEAEAAR